MLKQTPTAVLGAPTRIGHWVIALGLTVGCSDSPTTPTFPRCNSDASVCASTTPMGDMTRGQLDDMGTPRFAPPLMVSGSVNCSFGDCARDGWSGTESGSCSFGDCVHDGWRGTLADGSSYSVSCKFSDCATDGWTMDTDAGRFDTSCKFGSCFEDGWRTTTPDGETIDVSCSFGDCARDGWRIDGPDGSLSCSCSFSNCATDGVSCQ